VLLSPRRARARAAIARAAQTGADDTAARQELAAATLAEQIARARPWLTPQTRAVLAAELSDLGGAA